MHFDHRVLLLLRHSVLACALASASLAGCGGDDAKQTDTNNAGDGTDDPSDSTDTSNSDSSTSSKKDAGTKTPAKGGGGPSTGDGGVKDAGLPVKGVDAGTTSGNGGSGDGGAGTSGLEPDAPSEASASAMGKYPVKTYTSGYADSPAYADATMHYPDGLAGPLPSIAIVPGFVSPQSTIAAWGPFLASHGIVTFTIGTNVPTDDPPTRSMALLGALDTIKSENTRADSPLKGKLDLNRMAIGGWSMGGGGTLITLNAHPELKAGIAFCPWDPGATFPSIKTPILFLAAKNDELAAGQSQPFYESIPNSTPKILWERSDADHFQNDPTYEMGAMGRYGLSFLKVYLDNDDRYKQFLLEKAPNASDWRSTVQ
jgi:dienelactone hydrolase